jgi:predicted dithiol-disulfide oxidoreductase (DUF899 family)
MAETTERYLPPIVSRDEYRATHADFLKKEKAYMRQGDALAAERRRLPMEEVTKAYTFDSTEGPKTLDDLFAGYDTLMVYHFMFHPDWDAGCDGCSMSVDHFGPVVHMQARGVNRVLVSRAPLPKLQAYRQRMGWDEEWVSSFGTDFNADFDATVGDEEHHHLSIFLKAPDGRIFRTYDMGNRGTETFVSSFKLLDITPYGRREVWEDAPEGTPQGEPYAWWRRHDEYAFATASGSCCHEPAREVDTP